jgi:uroporphyrinogen decarboxylase
LRRYIELMKDSAADVIGLDWNTSMAEGRAIFGPDRVLQGNMDPMYLFASDDRIRQEAGAENTREHHARGVHTVCSGGWG